MDHLARCAFVHAQVACALAEIAAMQAENETCRRLKRSPKYSYADFMAIQDQYLIGHNRVIEYLR